MVSIFAGHLLVPVNLFAPEALLATKRDRFARFHFIKLDLQFLKFGSETISVLNDAGKSSEVLRNRKPRADRLGGLRSHLWFHAEVSANIDQRDVDRIVLTDRFHVFEVCSVARVINRRTVLD